MDEDKDAQYELLIQQEYDALINDYLNSCHRKNVEKIDKAFQFAKQAHSGVKRRSGEPYILHPIAVARIVAKDIGLGSTSICASLLHDVVEDTDTTVEDIENIFGHKIAQIVDGLTKISGGVFGEKASKQAENFRKLLLTMSEDIRVILIKIADRLHNMRTLGSMPLAKQIKIAGETEYIYAPLAHRLGLFPIKIELENLSFKFEHPETYKEIESRLEEQAPFLNSLFEDFSVPIKESLDKMGLDYTITSRVKSAYSIWKKMQKKNIPFEEVFDILALRIVFTPKPDTDEREQCWLIYSAITKLFKPHPDRTRDWLSTPKSNGYEALHVTIMGHSGQWMEVQIRSDRMNEIAEKGFAAHWKYKTGEQDESELDRWMKTIKELLKNPETNAIEFMDTFKLSLFASEIFVFTPKGEIWTLPQGATVLDYAFSIHTQLGLHCIGAKINHKLEPLTYVLQSGDQVEILTSNKQQPQQDWINYVVTAKAQSKIKGIFKRQYKIYENRGSKIFKDEMERRGIVVTKAVMDNILQAFHLKDEEDLYYKIGREAISCDDIQKEVFKDSSQNVLVKYWKLQFGGKKKKEKSDNLSNSSKLKKNKILTITEDETNYRIASCCSPIPGDEVVGFMEDDGVVVVHKRNCPNAIKLKASSGDKLVEADWETHKMLSFPAVLDIKGFDRVGVLIQIAKIISEEYNVNMHKVNIDTKDGLFEAKIHIYVHDIEDINNLCMNLIKLDCVTSVVRVENDNEELS